MLINDKGKIFACESEWPHQGSPMQAGIVKENVISCSRHGWHYDLANWLKLEDVKCLILSQNFRRYGWTQTKNDAFIWTDATKNSVLSY